MVKSLYTNQFPSLLSLILTLLSYITTIIHTTVENHISCAEKCFTLKYLYTVKQKFQSTDCKKVYTDLRMR